MLVLWLWWLRLRVVLTRLMRGRSSGSGVVALRAGWRRLRGADNGQKDRRKRNASIRWRRKKRQWSKGTEQPTTVHEPLRRQVSEVIVYA